MYHPIVIKRLQGVSHSIELVNYTKLFQMWIADAIWYKNDHVNTRQWKEDTFQYTMEGLLCKLGGRNVQCSALKRIKLNLIVMTGNERGRVTLFSLLELNCTSFELLLFSSFFATWNQATAQIMSVYLPPPLSEQQLATEVERAPLSLPFSLFWNIFQGQLILNWGYFREEMWMPEIFSRSDKCQGYLKKKNITSSHILPEERNRIVSC